MAGALITLAVMGMDQHENGAVAVARILREAQMPVSYLGRFQTPRSVAEGAIGAGAKVIGVSCHSWEYLQLVPELLKELRRRGAAIPVVIGGSVITATDAQAMRAAGVAAVFAAGARDTDILDRMRELAAGAPPPPLEGADA